jgi:hypothetical protein
VVGPMLGDDRMIRRQGPGMASELLDAEQLRA